MATNRPRSLQIYDPVLTNVARSYRSHGFIARDILPKIPVTTLSGQYPVFTKSFWFQNDVSTLIVDRAGTKEVDFEWSTETYLAREHGLKVSWSDLEAQQALGILRFEASKTEFLTQRMELAYEIEVATILRKTDVAGGGLNLGVAPSVNWDQDTATIEADIKTGVLAIYDATGQTPNVIVIPFKVAYAMALQEDIRAILRYDVNGAAPGKFLEVGDRVLPAVIHGMRVLIPRGSQVDSTNEGAASPVISEIWGDHVRLLLIDPAAGWGIPSVAYRMEHTAKKVTRWRTVDPDLTYVREMERYDIKIVAPDCGYEIKTVLS